MSWTWLEDPWKTVQLLWMWMSYFLALSSWRSLAPWCGRKIISRWASVASGSLLEWIWQGNALHSFSAPSRGSTTSGNHWLFKRVASVAVANRFVLFWKLLWIDASNTIFFVSFKLFFQGEEGDFLAKLAKLVNGMGLQLIQCWQKWALCFVISGIHKKLPSCLLWLIENL